MHRDRTDPEAFAASASTPPFELLEAAHLEQGAHEHYSGHRPEGVPVSALVDRTVLNQLGIVVMVLRHGLNTPTTFLLA